MKESLHDTVIATFINYPLNFMLVAVAFYLEMGVFATSTFITGIMFIIAVVRKYLVRSHYAKKYST